MLGLCHSPWSKVISVDKSSEYSSVFKVLKQFYRLDRHLIPGKDDISITLSNMIMDLSKIWFRQMFDLSLRILLGKFYKDMKPCV